ncbi:MAG: HD domain-containing protein [Muribaculaceae bacterium]|nr:HD domain-containing protein [Muribaculaceae bacterium]
MNPLEIINRYYTPGSPLYNLLHIHSEMVTKKALEIAEKAPFPNPDLRFIEEAAMLHDIGIFRCNAPDILCNGSQPYIQHGVIGSELLQSLNLPDHALVCERHTGSGLSATEIIESRLPLPPRDMLPLSPEEKIICYADKFFSKSGDPTEEKSLEQILKSMARHGSGPLNRFIELHNLLTGENLKV